MKKFISFLLVLVFMESYGQVAINESGVLPHASAILDVRAKDKGLLIPQNPDPNGYINKPAEGLVVYNNTDKNINYFNGKSWQGVASKSDIKPDDSLYGRFPNSKGFFASFNINNIDFATYTWVVPAGITKIWVEGWAGGQGGYKIKDRYVSTDRLPVGGAAGNFGSFIISVIPNETITIKVGKGGFLGEDNFTNLAGDTIIETIEGTYKIEKNSLFEQYLNVPELMTMNGLIKYAEGESGESSVFTTDLIAGRGGNAYPNQKGGTGTNEKFNIYREGGGTTTYLRTPLFYSSANDGQMPGGGGGVGVVPGKGGPGMVILHW